MTMYGLDETTEKKLEALARAISDLYPEVGWKFGHIVFEDFNFDSVDWAIAHLNDFYGDAVKEHGAMIAHENMMAALYGLLLMKPFADAARLNGSLADQWKAENPPPASE